MAMDDKKQKTISKKLQEKRSFAMDKKGLKEKSPLEDNSPSPQDEKKAKGEKKSGEASISLLKNIKKAKENSPEKDSKKALEEELSKKLKQALEDSLYLRADFENFKRRSAEEKQKLIRYGGEGIILSLANEVLDDLERAMDSAEKEQSFESLKKGLDMIQKKFSQVLNRFGVQVLDPTGKAFDPSYQEALSHIETLKVPEGHVAKTFKKAYKFHDKVIRPAQVVLAKKGKKD